MATASALEGLGPMQRKDSMAGKMIKMFKKPEEHTDFLTSSRFAHDLIKVRRRSSLASFVLVFSTETRDTISGREATVVSGPH